jgi:hypothetical protein
MYFETQGRGSQEEWPTSGSLMSAGIALALLQSRGGGLHVESPGLVADGSIGDAACRLRTRKCPRAAYSMIHKRELEGAT